MSNVKKLYIAPFGYLPKLANDDAHRRDAGKRRPAPASEKEPIASAA
ncbi:MAG TPA: hypothetical protein VFB90_03590 [Dehalococcoidia bacterium]|nr:hypothetical protein [Dehalococcoidia bacterium]